MDLIDALETVVRLSQEGLLRPLPERFEGADSDEIRDAVHLVEDLIVNHGEDLEAMGDTLVAPVMPEAVAQMEASESALDRAVSTCLHLAAHQLAGCPETQEALAVVRVEEFWQAHGADICSRLRIIPMTFEA